MIIDLSKKELPEEVKQILDQINDCLIIGLASSKELCNHVLAYKLLGFRKVYAMKCMEELMRRRNLGDDFEFEDYIDKLLKESPKIESVDMSKVNKIIKANL